MVTTGAVTRIAKRITIRETDHGKLPGCYAGKTFDLTCSPVDDSIPHGPHRWISYTSTLKNGKPVLFTQFLESHSERPNWIVRKASGFAGTWLHDVDVETD